jgi:hypothetical protein
VRLSVPASSLSPSVDAEDRDNPDASPDKWDDRLKEIAGISTVQSFWQVFNNTPFTNLPLKDSLHLFKKNVKPLWEDPRNKNGGAWTFRVPKAQSHEFWKEVLMMAIGEILQEVVEKGLFTPAQRWETMADGIRR